MTRLNLAALPLAALLSLTPSYGQGVKGEATGAKTFSDIRQVDFKNFAYTRPFDEEAEAVELRDGKRVGADDQGWSGLARITYGDLTGDGGEEAVILLRGQNTRISRTLDEVFVYTLKDGKPAALASFEGGRRGEYVLSVGSLGSNFKVEDRTLVLDLAVWREGEHWPTHFYTVKYRWNGIQMAEVERSCLKPLPEGMREVG